MRIKPPRSFEKKSLKDTGAPLILLVVMLAQWAVLLRAAGPSWDAAVYYAYARSIVFDGDLHIANDLQLSYPTAATDFAEARFDQERTENGRVASPFAIGSAILWLPWLAILRLATAVGQLTGQMANELTGFEWYFTLGISTLSMMLSWLAFWLAYRLALQVSGRPAALLATLTLLFATPLLYYAYAEALFAHATAAFITSAFVFVWWRYFRPIASYASALATGLLLGLAVLVRWQHIVYMALPLSTVTVWWFSLEGRERRNGLRRALLTALLIMLGTAVMVTPQLAHWQSVFGSWITIPQGATFMDWRASHWRQVLFSSFKGLLPWMPVFFLSLAGLLLQIRKQRRLVIPLLIVLGLSVYFNSSTNDWFGGGGYGPRRFTSELAILVIGYAGLLQALPRRIRLMAGGLAAVLLILHQWILLRFGLIASIGGQVLSMAPDYSWSESGYRAFFQQVGAHLADFVRQPLQMLHWPDSPLGILYSGQLPLRHSSLLAATFLFLAFLGLLAGRIGDRQRDGTPTGRWLALAGIGLTVLAVDLWIIFKA